MSRRGGYSDTTGWRTALVDRDGFQIDEDEVQRARLPSPVRSREDPAQAR